MSMSYKDFFFIWSSTVIINIAVFFSCFSSVFISMNLQLGSEFGICPECAPL